MPGLWALVQHDANALLELFTDGGRYHAVGGDAGGLIPSGPGGLDVAAHLPSADARHLLFDLPRQCTFSDV